MSNAIKESWSKVEPTPEAQERMLRNILLRQGGFTTRRVDRLRVFMRVAVTAACAACCMLILYAAVRLSAGDIKSTASYSAARPGATTDLAPDFTATIYIPTDDNSSLTAEQVTCKGNAPQDRLDELIANKVLPEGLRYNSYTVADDGAEYSNAGTAGKTAGENTIKIDLPSSFVGYLNSLSAAREKIVMAALVDTCLDRFDRARSSVLITADGKGLVTARNDYSGKLKWMDYPQG